LPATWTADLLEELDQKHIDTLLLYSVEEVWPFRESPLFRDIDLQRLHDSNARQIEFIPGLDHGMHFADGRTRAVEILDQHVLKHFGGVDREPESESVFT
jgi:hypothetical protein